MNDKIEVISAVLVMLGLIVTFVFIMVTISSSYETRHVFIDGNDIISYEVVKGDTIIIVTENETYEVELFEDVVDFTVSSDIYIELSKGYQRSFFWDDFEPTDNAYWINRIIKIPE